MQYKNLEKSKRSTYIYYLLIGIFAIIVISGRLFFSGEKYGLNYSVYQPDGICYTKIAADISNYDSGLLNRQLSGLYPNIGMADISSLNCESIKARLLYPLLSAPFLRAFGVSGMLVVPIVSYLIMLILLASSLDKARVGIYAKVTLLALVLMSSTYSRWYIANIVDPLLITLCTILIYILTQTNALEKIGGFIPITLIIILMALTKRSLHLVLICGIVLIIAAMKSRKSLEINHFWTKVVSLFFLIPFFLDFLIGKFLGKQNGLKSIVNIQQCIQSESSSFCEQVFKSFDSHATLTVLAGTSETSITNQSITDLLLTKSSLLIDSLTNVIQISINYIFVSLAQIFVVDLPLACVFILWFISLPYLWRNLNLLNGFSFFSPMLINLIASLNGTLGLNYRFEMAFFFPVFISLAIRIDEYLRTSIN